MAFIRLRTACVGCALARFCTLDDVSTAYGIPRARIRRAIDQAEQAAAGDPSSGTSPDDHAGRRAQDHRTTEGTRK
jgi:hypothetical protein